MRPLSAQQMLAVWERGLDQIPLERALALLEAACPELDRESLARMSIGQRDDCLLRLREWAFGRQVSGCMSCQTCGQPLEAAFTTDSLRHNAGEPGPERVPLSIAGYDLMFRPVNSLDLAACMGVPPSEVARRLFLRCLVSANTAGAEVSGEQVPAELAEPAMDDLTHADPQANLEIISVCGACGASVRECFDVVAFFWSEIDAWARRILREVHLLASAYGWTETDVLSLSSIRRQFYLEMAGA
ncbi:MAG TPA: hypothetical protein VE783_06705 [Candidatus Limnocylindrales bacterium]|nr:hypothetical protein [Candidatus Limnocylindrales bacterium]